MSHLKPSEISNYESDAEHMNGVRFLPAKLHPEVTHSRASSFAK